jgi:dihydrolipoamide dehydrogenase
VPENFDIAVIGGGVGGYVAAIRAAQLGAHTAIVEKDRFGGTCLVRGCIPTKALLQSSELYHLVAQQGPELGIKTQGIEFDLEAAQGRRVKVVDQLVSGVESLLETSRVTVLRGAARLSGKGRFSIDGESHQSRDILVATGSVPSRIPIEGVEHTIDSDRILELRRVPERMVVIGGGVVGMEWGALYAALGTRVTVLELLPQILPMVESDMIGMYRRHFERLGGVIHTEARVEAVSRARGGLEVRFAAGGETQAAAGDVVLLAAGRSPYTEGLGLDGLGVELERGRVVVDRHLRTDADGIWAIGDVIGGIMLAHVASYEGVCAVENIRAAREGSGGLRSPDYHAAPNCIYTDPEIAHVGLGEREAREQGRQVTVGRFPFAASGRAMTLGQTEGAIKVVADAGDGTVLGVHMVGPRVTDVIAEATLAVQQRLKLHDLELTMHAHPTLAESLLEAALAADGRAIHIANRRRPAAAGAGQGQTTARVGETNHENGAKRPAREDATVAQATERPAGSAPPEASGPASTLAVDPGKLKLTKTNRDDLLKTYRLMLLIRRFEERARVEYTRANIGGYCHLNLGEEATVVGGLLPLRAGDYVYTSYREHGHAIARGLEPRTVMAELFGRETGTSHGRGGSMHIFDYRRRFMGGYGIVGGHLPLAVGAAFSIKYHAQVLGEKAAEGGQDIVFCMFGDGATNIGAFHESLNLAKVLEVPVVWFCVNNQYGMGTSVSAASAVAEIHKRACAYDMESIRVDGMDVLEVMRRTNEMVEKTRRDSQPRLIEAVSYRFMGHSVIDPDKYRSEEEKARWRESDPLLLFEHRLEQGKVAGREDFDRLEKEVAEQVEEAVRFASDSPNPPVEELYRHLYADELEQAHEEAPRKGGGGNG